MHVLCQLCYYIVFEKQPNGAGWTGGNVRVHGHGRLTPGIHMEVAPAHPLPSKTHKGTRAVSCAECVIHLVFRNGIENPLNF